MLRRTLTTCLLAVSLCAAPLYSRASDSFEALLKQADSVRSSDPKAFQHALAKLNAAESQATAPQRNHLAYLNAYAQAYSGHFDVAIGDAQRLLTATTDASLQFRTGALIVNSYAATRQFTEGLRQLERTLKLSGQIKDDELLQHGYGVAALLYNQIGQYQLGLHYAEKILAEPSSPRTLCYGGHFKLEAQLNLGKLTEDDHPVNQVIEQCRRQDELIIANSVRATLARKWAAHGERDRAIVLLGNSLPEVEATRYPRLIGEIESLLAEYLLAEGDVAGAEKHALVAIERSAGITNSLPLVTAYKTMYQIADRQNDQPAAFMYYRGYAEADKAYLNDVKARELAYQIVRQETFQQTQQIELLNRKNQVLQLQQRVEKQSKQNTQLIAALLAMLVASIGYWAYKIKRMQMSFRRLAETDALTGISNRHHFTDQAEEALAYCERTGEDVGLIMFDLDRFKSINDQYGHVTGDCVLKHVAEACRSLCRKNDRFGRVGGEEFAMLLIGCDLAVATQMARNCCARIAEIDTSDCGAHFPVTASFGVTAASLSGYELTKMLSHADQMLYRSKNAGRNQVSVFPGVSAHVGMTAPQTA